MIERPPRLADMSEEQLDQEIKRRQREEFDARFALRQAIEEKVARLSRRAPGPISGNGDLDRWYSEGGH